MMGDKFEYKYSAPSQEERKEIDNIRNKYLPKDKSTSDLEKLRQLDNKVKNIPIIYSLSIGIVGVLLFGTGLTFFLEWVNYFYIGIPFALFGVLFMLLAYPLYKFILKKYKDRYGKEILELSNKLLNNDD